MAPKYEQVLRWLGPQPDTDRLRKAVSDPARMRVTVRACDIHAVLTDRDDAATAIRDLSEELDQTLRENIALSREAGEATGRLTTALEEVERLRDRLREIVDLKAENYDHVSCLLRMREIARSALITDTGRG